MEVPVRESLSTSVSSGGKESKRVTDLSSEEPRGVELEDEMEEENEGLDLSLSKRSRKAPAKASANGGRVCSEEDKREDIDEIVPVEDNNRRYSTRSSKTSHAVDLSDESADEEDGDDFDLGMPLASRKK